MVRGSPPAGKKWPCLLYTSPVKEHFERGENRQDVIPRWPLPIGRSDLAPNEILFGHTAQMWGGSCGLPFGNVPTCHRPLLTFFLKTKQQHKTGWSDPLGRPKKCLLVIGCIPLHPRKKPSKQTAPRKRTEPLRFPSGSSKWEEAGS